MAGWKRIVRGAIGTGLVFSVGSTVAALCVGVAAMIFGTATLADLSFAGRVGVAGFILGVGFSGILAVASRNRRFTQLSLPKFAGFGALAGLAYFLLISINGAGVWSFQTMLTNFLLLTLLGSGAATATLLVARKAGGSSALGSELDAGDELSALGEGSADTSFVSSNAREKKSARNR